MKKTNVAQKWYLYLVNIDKSNVYSDRNIVKIVYEIQNIIDYIIQMSYTIKSNSSEVIKT